MASIMQEMLNQFESMIGVVRADFQAKGVLLGGGHGFDHDYVVASYCLQIAEGNLSLATLAWVAAMFHSIDRHFGDDMVEPMAEKYLAHTNIPDVDKALILDAVLNHSKRQPLSDNPVTPILMDADKLANIMMSVIFRSAQFQPNLPILDLRYPDASVKNRPPGTSYKNPGSLIMDLMGCDEWSEPGWLHTKKAKELAEPMFQKLRQFIGDVIDQYRAVGLLDYPFKEDFAK